MKRKILVLLVMTLLIGTTMAITTAEYDENQNILFEQNPPADNSIPQYEWLSDTSVVPPLISPNFVYDDFFNIEHPIHGITWWGNEYTGDFPDLVSADHENILFNIIFYDDDNGEPGNEVCVYTDVTAEITDTGIEYIREASGAEPQSVSLYRFYVSQLIPPCTLSDGWITIQAVDGDDEWFYWQESFDGNGQFLYGATLNNLDPCPSEADMSLVFRTAVPDTITFDGPDSGNYGEEQTYTIMADGYPDYDMYYYIDWGDGTIDEWIGPHPAGETIDVIHTWDAEGNYTIQAKAKNSLDMETEYVTLEISMPKTKEFTHPFLQFLEQHPHLFPLLRQLIYSIDLLH